MYSKHIYNTFFCCTLSLGAVFFVKAQSQPLYFKDAIQEKRNAFYNKVVTNINKAIVKPFTPENEESWNGAFYNIGLLQYKTAAVNSKMDSAAKYLFTQSNEFKKAFINLINSNYQQKYYTQVKSVFVHADDHKLMAMAAHYLLPKANTVDIKMMQKQAQQKLLSEPDNAILFELNNQLQQWGKKITTPSLKSFFAKDYLQGEVLLFSFQRKNRNYPGLAMVRKPDGTFYKNQNGSYFSVGQLARSNSNMPGYITNGNTPQGIFRMTGFDTSSNYFIGPTTNIQLAMPHEYDGTQIQDKFIDTTWSFEQYKNLLPDSFKNYQPIYGTFYAGKAGRTEIISHGTTIDINYYKSNSFYPYTPTAGCLCTKEIWNNKTGFIDTSDQLLLSQAIQNAGGAKGYLIVIEIDDKNTPVTLQDLAAYLK
jgi:hypothetical protein